MRWALLFLLFLGGCATAPASPGAMPSSDDRATAMRVVDRELRSRHLPSPVAVARILWIRGDRVALDDMGGDKCGVGEVGFHGGFPTCEVFVPAAGMRPSDSAFAHELVHCVLSFANNDPDMAHEDSAWTVLLPALKAALRREGV